MRLTIMFCLSAFAMSCAGGKKFASTTPVTSGEAPQADPPASEPLPDPIDTESVPPGEPVERFGINFEDNPFSEDSDKDYNDAVLCFEGKFAIQGNAVVSSEAQTIVASAFTNAGCSHDIEIIVTHPDGSSESPAVHDLIQGQEKSIEITFGKGDAIEVKMGNTGNATEGICANQGRHSMKEAAWAQIAKNTCNDTGE